MIFKRNCGFCLACGWFIPIFLFSKQKKAFVFAFDHVRLTLFTAALLKKKPPMATPRTGRSVHDPISPVMRKRIIYIEIPPVTRRKPRIAL